VKYLALAALLVGACAPSMHPPPAEPLSTLPPAVRLDVTDTEQELKRLAAELDVLSVEAAPSGCARVTVLRDNICTLAERICRLAEQYPGELTLPPRCKDARHRCGRAADAVKHRGCGP